MAASGTLPRFVRVLHRRATCQTAKVKKTSVNCKLFAINLKNTGGGSGRIGQSGREGGCYIKLVPPT